MTRSGETPLLHREEKARLSEEEAELFPGGSIVPASDGRVQGNPVLANL
jgi:hypothetical protein